MIEYSTTQKYKFKLPDRIFYTGFVIDEDDISVKVKTIYNEEIVLSKQQIIISTKVKEVIRK